MPPERHAEVEAKVRSELVVRVRLAADVEPCGLAFKQGRTDVRLYAARPYNATGL